MVLISSDTALSVSANAKSTDRVSGTYQFLPGDPGVLYDVTLYCRGSATGLNAQLFVNGTAVINDLALSATGTAGAISKIDHELATIQAPGGSRVELFFRNTTGGALTVDQMLEADI